MSSPNNTAPIQSVCFSECITGKPHQFVCTVSVCLSLCPVSPRHTINKPQQFAFSVSILRCGRRFLLPSFLLAIGFSSQHVTINKPQQFIFLVSAGSPISICTHLFFLAEFFISSKSLWPISFTQHELFMSPENQPYLTGMNCSTISQALPACDEDHTNSKLLDESLYSLLSSVKGYPPTNAKLFPYQMPTHSPIGRRIEHNPCQSPWSPSISGSKSSPCHPEEWRSSHINQQTINKQFQLAPPYSNQQASPLVSAPKLRNRGFYCVGGGGSNMLEWGATRILQSTTSTQEVSASLHTPPQGVYCISIVSALWCNKHKIVMKVIVFNLLWMTFCLQHYCLFDLPPLDLFIQCWSHNYW